jgi:hypothetical protein
MSVINLGMDGLIQLRRANFHAGIRIKYEYVHYYIVTTYSMVLNNSEY